MAVCGLQEGTNAFADQKIGRQPFVQVNFNVPVFIRPGQVPSLQQTQAAPGVRLLDKRPGSFLATFIFHTPLWRTYV